MHLSLLPLSFQDQPVRVACPRWKGLMVQEECKLHLRTSFYIQSMLPFDSYYRKDIIQNKWTWNFYAHTVIWDFHSIQMTAALHRPSTAVRSWDASLCRPRVNEINWWAKWIERSLHSNNKFCVPKNTYLWFKRKCFIIINVCCIQYA